MSDLGRFIGNIFRGPKQRRPATATGAPLTENTAKATADKAAATERAEARRRAARAFGRSATALTGGNATGAQVRKTTLGG